MAKRKYSIIDENGEDRGFVVIETAATFEQITRSALIPHDGPLADSILFVTVLSSITLVLFLTGLDGLIAAFIGIFLTCVLAGIKAWRGQIMGEPGSPNDITIKVETWENNRAVLEEIKDKTISIEELQKVAHAVVVDGLNFSRPALQKCITQPTYHKIKDEFVRLRFAHKDGNSYKLSPRALAFLRKVQRLDR